MGRELPSTLNEELNERWEFVRCQYPYPNITQRLSQCGLNPIPLWKTAGERHTLELHSNLINFYHPVSTTKSKLIAKQVLNWTSYSRDTLIYIPPFSVRAFDATDECRVRGLGWWRPDGAWAEPDAMYHSMSEWIAMGKLSVKSIKQMDGYKLIITCRDGGRVDTQVSNSCV